MAWQRTYVSVAIALSCASPVLNEQPVKVLNLAIANASTSSPEEDRVVVSRDDFQKNVKGQRFRRWRDFKEALGPDAELEPEVGGEERLVGGLSVAFVIILNVLVWSVIAYVIAKLGAEFPVAACWTIFAFLIVYAGCVYAYCRYAYQFPSQRLVTNFLFGAVPLAVSAASYVLALLLLHFSRLALGEDTPKIILDRLDPWNETLPGRLIFFLAVLPGFATSIYLGNTVSTGFTHGATHFDVLSLCLFIDVGRFFGHASYLIAREWSIGKSPTAMSSRPGLCYIFHLLCMTWYLALARLEAGHVSVVIADGTKITTLVCLTSYVFFPLSLYLILTNLDEFMDQFEKHRPVLRTCLLITCVFLLAIFMLAVAMVFDTIEPNLMGIGAMLWVVFFGAYKMSTSEWGNTIPPEGASVADNNFLLKFIFALLLLSAVAFGAVVVSAQHAETVRRLLLAPLAP